MQMQYLLKNPWGNPRHSAEVNESLWIKSAGGGRAPYILERYLASPKI